MVVETELCHQSVPLLDVQYRCIAKVGGIQKVEEIVEIPVPSTSGFRQICANSVISLSADVKLDLLTSNPLPDASVGSGILPLFPCIRSGSFSDIGPRSYMEDEHIRVDDLSAHFGSTFKFPMPSAFYGVFDGHGGAHTASYLRKNFLRFFFQEANFPPSDLAEGAFMDGVESAVRNAFLSADLALADDCNISTSSGSAVLAALVFGRLLLVANSGDCRAVLCRKGEAVDMSQDRKPIYASERRRVEDSGGFVDDGYLNGLLSVSRALGDWDMKLPKGSVSPLIAEPELRRIVLTEDDEFLIIGCDGIWDVMSSQEAVTVVQRGLRRHDDPERCAKELVMEALRKNIFDNLTVVAVCFSNDRGFTQSERPRLRCSAFRQKLCAGSAACSIDRLGLHKLDRVSVHNETGSISIFVQCSLQPSRLIIVVVQLNVLGFTLFLTLFFPWICTDGRKCQV